jgi:hypothetical protein
MAPTVPGWPTIGMRYGSRPRSRPSSSRSAAAVNRHTFAGPSARSVATPSMNGFCEIAAASRSSSAAITAT